MENLIPINNNALFKWRLLRNDGSPFAVDLYSCKLAVMMGRGRTAIKSFSITGPDKNILSWELDFSQMHFIGNCSLSAVIMRKGIMIASVEKRDAFRVVANSRRSCDCTQTIELTSFVNIIHDVEDDDKQLTVLFPTFEVDDNMHLHIKGTTDQHTTNFSLDEEGHLIYTQ